MNDCDGYAKEYATLAPQHLEFLKKRGILPAVSRARGYRSETVKAHLGRLGFSPKQRITPALLIPIWPVAGKVESYQLRPDNPRLDEKGKPRKYETQAGARMRLDVHSFLMKSEDA